MEAKLVAFIEKILKELSSTDPTSHNKQRTLVFLPVGVPGMGKTTLGRFLESAS
jgi:signal recognition particle GTPase